jgi:hypothetical protein
MLWSERNNGMVQQTTRYYIRDAETNELWCFDARYYSGDVAVN